MRVERWEQRERSGVMTDPGRVSGMHSYMPAILVAAAGFACSASVAGAQEALPSGEIVERIWAAFDSTQSYAAYLPSDYDASRRWPILFLMDPRGRALVPVALFQAAAEEHG